MNWQTIGFKNNKSFFENAKTGQSLSHAYLFTGPDMIGKKTFALELAGFLSDSKTNPADNPDILLIQPDTSQSETSISIEKARTIKQFLTRRPYIASRKIVLIDEAQSLTHEAQSALLKILEEASPSSVIILITAKPRVLLDTIFSRCQEIKFKPAELSELEDFLAEQKISSEEKIFLIKICQGKIGLASRIIKSGSFKEVSEQFDLLAKLMKGDINSRLQFAQKVSDSKNRDNYLKELIFFWLLYARMRLREVGFAKILRGLLRLAESQSRPSYNQKLALENFLIQL